MLKDLVRLLGISFILSGIFLYFYTSPKDDSVLQEENDLLNDQVIQLQTQLEQTEQELAHLQTLTSDATVQQKDEKSESADHASHDEESVSTLTLVIEDGTTSQDVAQKLETAKVIEEAKIFNDYLKDQGLTTSIQIGEHYLDATMSIETISKIITTLPKED